MEKFSKRDSLGRFMPEGKEKKKPQRWIRISDDDWDALAEKAASRRMTRTQLIEELARS